MITGAPGSGALSKAYQFCSTLLTLQHTIGIVFFYHESVQLLATDSQDSIQPWLALQDAHKLSYHLCSTSVAQYAIQLSPETIKFSLSGLGVWSQELRLADRVIVFKGGEQ